MTTVATQNFRSVDRLLAAPSMTAAQDIQALGRDEARRFLRYQVSEQNRWYFEMWEYVQLGLGAVLALILWFGVRQHGAAFSLSILMLGGVLAARLYMTPEIIRLGRLIDFVPAVASSPERSHFWTLHAAYSTLEVVKWGLALILAGKLILRTKANQVRSAGKST